MVGIAGCALGVHVRGFQAGIIAHEVFVALVSKDNGKREAFPIYWDFDQMAKAAFFAEDISVYDLAMIPGT